MKRSWASDRDNLTKSLNDLGARARASAERPAAVMEGQRGSRPPQDMRDGDKDDEEVTPLLPSKRDAERSPLWLLIFPEGTITSDEERVKSVRYAEKEGIVSLTLCTCLRYWGGGECMCGFNRL
jgi:1-acyl-sn-glycerol-3-phosphate acyltransferase